MNKSKCEIGLNLRVTDYLDQGVREYMEDYAACHFEKDGDKIVFGFFGIFDGHGGPEAAQFAKSVLINEIKALDKFWSTNDKDVISAIKEGFLNTHQLMWKERDKWPRTASGYKSTSGTTASVVIIRNQKLYVGHAGDSAIVIGRCEKEDIHSDWWKATLLTEEHKPSNPKERERIERVGGSLMRKAGVDRVVWSRPKINPMMNSSRSSQSNKSAEYERIPFLAVARSLGDLWSYDIINEEFHVSPEPDVEVIPLQIGRDRCVILGSDGLWNMVSKEAAVEIIRICERETERKVLLDPESNARFFYNPAASLVKYSVKTWNDKNMRADNISAIVILLDPPGPSMSKRREERRQQNFFELDIPSAFTQEMNLESFMLSSFLVECTNWKNANKLNNDAELSKDSSQKMQASAVTENVINSAPFLTTTVVSSSASHDVKPTTAAGKPSLQSVLKKRTPTKAVLVDFDQDEEANNCVPAQLTQKDQDCETDVIEDEDEDDEVECNSNSRPRVSILTKEYLTNHNYTKYTQSWRNDTEMWNAIAEDLWILECFTVDKIAEHISSYSTESVPQRLEVLPWAFAAKRVLSEINDCRLLASNFDLFHPVWLQFYERHIRPIVGAKNLSKQKMYECIGSLKSLLVPYLKEKLKSSQENASSRALTAPPIAPSQFNKRGINQTGEVQMIHKSEPARKRPVLARQIEPNSVKNLPPIVPLRIHSSPLIPSNLSPFVPFPGGRSVTMQRISAKYMAKPVVTPNEELAARDIEKRIQSHIVNPMSIPGSNIVESVVLRGANAQSSSTPAALTNRLSLQTSSFLKPPLFTLNSQKSTPTTSLLVQSSTSKEVENLPSKNSTSEKTEVTSTLSTMNNEGDSKNISRVTTAVPDSTSKDKEPLKKPASQRKSNVSMSPQNTRKANKSEATPSSNKSPKAISSKSSSKVQKSSRSTPSSQSSSASKPTRITRQVVKDSKSDSKSDASPDMKSVKKITVKFLGRNIDVMTGAPVVSTKKSLKRLNEPKSSDTKSKKSDTKEKVSVRKSTQHSKNVLATRRGLASVKPSQAKKSVIRNLRSSRKRFSL